MNRRGLLARLGAAAAAAGGSTLAGCLDDGDAGRPRPPESRFRGAPCPDLGDPPRNCFHAADEEFVLLQPWRETVVIGGNVTVRLENPGDETIRVDDAAWAVWRAEGWAGGNGMEGNEGGETEEGGTEGNEGGEAGDDETEGNEGGEAGDGETDGGATEEDGAEGAGSDEEAIPTAGEAWTRLDDPDGRASDVERVVAHTAYAWDLTVSADSDPDAEGVGGEIAFEPGLHCVGAFPDGAEYATCLALIEVVDG